MQFGPGDQEDRRSDKDRLFKVGEDHWERFEGNNEDHFRLGIQVMSPMYESCLLSMSHVSIYESLSSWHSGHVSYV